MKSYETIAENVLKRRDEYVAKQKKIKRMIITTATPVLCCCVVLLTGVGIWKSTNPSKPNEETTSDIVIDTPIAESDIVIDSLDKLNFYAVKRAIAEGSDSETVSASALSSKSYETTTSLSSEATVDIDPDSTFTITMCSYFTVTITKTDGFLAQKLGGTGSVEVVITRNNFKNMITFKKGENYYSCLETSSTEKAMMFSSDRYVDGFKLVENYNQENYAFTVYFEGDSIVGINSGKSKSNIGEYKSVVDDIKMNDSFCIVSHKKQSFTAKQLENMFESNAAFVDDGVVLKDGTILFGEGSVTDNLIVFVTGSHVAAIKNSDIKKIKAMYSEEYGYCIKLELASSDIASDLKYLKLYINGIMVRELTVQCEDSSVYITNLNSKARTSDVFYELTAISASDRIGRIFEHSDFIREISKKLDLNDYGLSIENGGQYSRKYTYSLNYEKTLTSNTNEGLFGFDGMTFSLPVKVSSLIETGFVISNNYFDEQSMSGTIHLTSPLGFEVVAYVRQIYGNSTALKDCYVVSVSFDCFEDWEDALKGISPAHLDFMLFGGINKHTTLDDMISRLGAPNEIVFTSNSFDGNCAVELVYDISVPSYSNAKMYFYIKPIFESNAPSDFLVNCSFSLEQ